ncbi:MAG: tape measure protein [Liquorilactobacillus nagelii]|uniref:tape measure protein n=1 Tax=Liquorilactobacillus nagelii TaxID=82688 RepID=UPI0039EADC51
MVKKVDATMSTEIALDMLQASNSLKSITQLVNSATNSWKAQEAQLKSTGDYLGAAKAKYEGLSDAISAQESKIEALKNKQSSLKGGTEETARAYAKYQSQIDSATSKLSSMHAQQDRAKSAMELQQSGILQLNNSIKAQTSLMEATIKKQEALGDSQGASQSKIESLSNINSKYSEVLEKEKSILATVAENSGKSSDAYAKQATRVENLKTKIVENNNAIDKEKDKLSQQHSGINNLTEAIQHETSIMQASVREQMANGDAANASRTKIESLSSINSKYAEVLDKEKLALSKIKSASGDASGAYSKQAIKVAELKAKIAENNSAINNERENLEKSAPSGFFSSLKEKLVGTSEEVEKQEGLMHKATSYFVGGVLVNGFQNLTSNVKEFAEQGFESAEAAQEVAEKWKNMGASEADITTMGNSVKSLKENTNMSGTAVANLTTKFYDMTGSAKQTAQLTEGIGSLSDKLKLSSSQADNFSSSIYKVYSNGSLTQSTLSRLEKQAPGLGTALQQASGMSKTAFDNAVSAGKISSDQFSTILQKASKDYKKNSSEFDESSQGALKHIKQSWADTKQSLMTPLVNIAATGLSSLSTALEAPAMQNAIKQLGNGIANLGTKLTGVMKYVASHESDIQSIISSVVQITKLLAIGAWDTFKGAITGISNAFNDMTGKANKTKDPLKSVASFLKDVSSHKKAIENVGKALVVAFAAKSVISGIHSIANGARALYKDFNSLRNGISMARNAMVTIKTFAATNPFTFWITAITLVVAGFVELYKHNTKFRAFVNGLVKACQNFYKGAVKWFKQTWSSLTKGASNAWKNTKKFFSDGWNGAVKLTQSGYKNTTKWFSNTWSSMKKGASDAWTNTKKTFSNGWNETKKLTQVGATWVGNNWNTLKNTTIKTAQDLWKNQKGTFKDGYTTLNSYTQTWHDVMTGKWGKVGSDIKNTTNDFIKTIKSFFTGMYDWLNKITGGRLGDVLNTFKSIFGSISGVISGAVKGVKHAFGDIVRGILSPFNDMLSGLRKGINWVLDKVGATQIKSKWQIDVPNYATGTQGGVLHDQLALVNDAKGSNYREIYREPNGQIGMFPAQRNMIVPLKAGTEILDGNNSARLASLMGLQKYASGSIGNFFSGIFNKGKDLLEDADKIIAHPAQFLESVFTKFTSSISSGAGLASDIITNLPSTIAKSAISWIKNLFSEDAGGSSANPSGSGVQRWKDDVIKALKANGLSTSSDMVNKVLRQISTESGGNPNAKQPGSDPDGDGSGPALGLMQTKRSTFNANKFSGHGSIFNGYDNLLAALKYAKARYGSSLSYLGNGHGYANGGIATSPSVFGEDGAEMAIPLSTMKTSRAWELIGKTAAIVARNDNNSSSNSVTTDSSDMNDLIKKMDSMMNSLGKLADSFTKAASKPTQINMDGRKVAQTLAPELDSIQYNRLMALQRNSAIPF